MSTADRRRRSRTLLPLLLIALVCWLGGFLLPSPVSCLAAQGSQSALAQQAAPAAKAAVGLPQTTSLYLTMLKAMGALILILGLIVLIAIGLKKLGWGKDLPGRGGALIKVIDTRMLAPKKYVAVLQIADELMAVSITDQQINLLSRLEASEELTEALAARRAGPPALGSFAAILARARKSGRPDHPSQP